VKGEAEGGDYDEWEREVCGATAASALGRAGRGLLPPPAPAAKHQLLRATRRPP